MAGTASELYANNEDIFSERYCPGLNGFELFSSWLFGRADAKCLLLEIDQVVCNVLMPILQPVPTGDFKLIIMSPDDDKRVHTIINARAHWVDSALSSTHKKIHCSFEFIDADLRGEIKLLKSYLDSHYERYIKCSILKC